MTDPELLLVARLLADEAVVALVGARIRPVLAAENDALPYLVFERTSTEYDNSSDGEIQTAHVTIDVYCLDDDYAGVKALAAAVRAAVAGWTDANGNPWHIHGESDEAVPLVSGQEVVSGFMVNQSYGVHGAD